MRFSWQVYRGGLPFPPSVDHNLSEFSTTNCPSWVALHSMAYSFIELHKPLHHDKAVIHINKVSGYNEIPAELFTSLKKEAMKVLHSLCQQIWKAQQWSQDWKRSILIPIPKKGNTNEGANHWTIALISHASNRHWSCSVGSDSLRSCGLYPPSMKFSRQEY